MPCDRVGGFRFKYWDLFEGDFNFSRGIMVVEFVGGSFALTNFLWSFCSYDMP